MKSDAARDPSDIARALFDFAIADDRPDGDMKNGTYYFWDAIDLARDGTVQDSETEIVKDMTKRLETFLDEGRS